jgi:hypothetical protein
MFLTNIVLRILLVSTAVLQTSLRPPEDSGRMSKAPSVKWAIEKNSTLRVEGKSNVNTFRCDMEGYFRTDTISSIDDAPAGKQVRLKGAIVIDIFRFDCHHRIITSDLRKTLKADVFPKMTIRFISLERLPEFIGNAELVKGIVEIELAGSRKRFDILYSFVKPGGQTIYLNGGRSFSFSDFKLTPPRKLAGFIQISDNFDVNFRLTLTPVAN